MNHDQMSLIQTVIFLIDVDDQIWFEAFKHGIMLLILGSINPRFHNVVLEMSLCCYTIIFSSGPIFPFLVSI